MDISKLLWVDLRCFRDQFSSYHYLSEDWAVSCISHAESLDHEIRITNPALLCFEYDYPNIQALSALRQIRSLFPLIPIIMLTEQHSEALAIWALRIRVWDYFIKPLQPKDLVKSAATTLMQEATWEGNLPRPRQRLDGLSNPIPGELRFRPKQKSRTNPAQFFVETHYQKRISEETVAKLCGMNTSSFSRSFKKEHKMTFCDYLINFRISKARELLQNPNASVSDIAYSVGFQDPSYFTRIFRRIVGVSPSRYREVDRIH